jgi:ribosomal protein S18 acetylase RimI-like enzyme
VTIERVTTVDDALVAAWARLTPQLSSHRPPTADELREVIASERTHMLVARDDDGSIVGSLTLVLYRIPAGGLRALIEDVVVDESARGQGIGEGLTREAQQLATVLGAGAIQLTSRPEREAANRLYRRLGFEQRKTNVYVWRPQ